MSEFVGVALGFRPGNVVAMACVHLDATHLRRPVEPEGDKKLVQQAGMVIVASIFGIKLPISADSLAIVAEHPDRPVEEAPQLRQDRRPEIIFERLGILVECAE